MAALPAYPKYTTNIMERPEKRTVRKAAPKRAPNRPEQSSGGVRINKYLAQRGYATRRDADSLIEKGFVFVNGRRAAIGQQVHEKDTVTVKGAPEKTYRYAAYNKPVDIITHSPQNEELSIETATRGIRELRGLFPVGRLDKDSRGLIILTDDGRIIDRLLNPKFDHDKEYEVTVREPLPNNFQRRMESGVRIERYTTEPCTVEILGEHRFRITLHEGKKHQIRRMVAALGNVVTDLKRIRVLTVKLGNIKEGGWRAIEGKELQTFLQKLGLN